MKVNKMLRFSNFHFLFKKFNKGVAKNYSQAKTKETVVHPHVEYKPLFFYYQNVEYRAMLPSNYPQKTGEFLEKFAEEKTLNYRKMSAKDFEVMRGGRYLQLDSNLNEQVTKTYDPNPLVILDDKLTTGNLRFRGINHFRDPFNYTSHNLQEFLSKIIETSKLDTSKLDKKNIQKLLKSVDNLKGNNTKIIIALASYLENIKNAFSQNLELNFRTNYTLNLEELHKNNKSGLFILENKKLKLHIPINTVLAKNEEEKIAKFGEGIIDNFDTLRNMGRKFNLKSNFGIVTDFYNWKFTFFRKPENNSFESPYDYLTSLKYDLSITPDYVNEGTFFILSKLIQGLLTMDSDKLNSLQF